MFRANGGCGLCLPIGAAIISVAALATAQELEPRAYSISPQSTNFIVLALARSSGDISFDPALPIEDAIATVNATALGYTRAIGVAGRSASVGLVVPYAWGSVQGLISGSFQQAIVPDWRTRHSGLRSIFTAHPR